MAAHQRKGLHKLHYALWMCCNRFLFPDSSLSCHLLFKEPIAPSLNITHPQAGLPLLCSHCLHIFACQNKSKVHLSTAEDNTFKLEKKVIVSINQFPIFSRTGVRKEEDHVFTSPIASNTPNTSVISNCTTRLWSRRGLFHLFCFICFKDDATQFSIICRSLK